MNNNGNSYYKIINVLRRRYIERKKEGNKEACFFIKKAGDIINSVRRWFGDDIKVSFKCLDRKNEAKNNK